MNSKDWDRISNDFYSEILSPIQDSDYNPLFEDLKKLKTKKTVIDLGCGLGELTPYLKNYFKKIVGIDFSNGMVENAKKKNKNISHANFYQADMRKLSKFYNKFDVGISVNSVLTSQVKDVDLMFREIYNVLKPGGKFFTILPSMEVYIYQSMLLMDKEIKNGKTQTVARKKASKMFDKDEYDLLLGTITFDGDTEKCFYRFEINYRLKKAGFKNIVIKKVKYSWTEFKKAGQGYFPKSDRPWDWYVSCEKSL